MNIYIWNIYILPSFWQQGETWVVNYGVITWQNMQQALDDNIQ